jgi:hypothetical protein
MIAAGVTTLSKWMAGPCTFALGVVFLIFVLTLHIPRVIADARTPSEWSSALIALAMCGASWICASGSSVAAPHPADAVVGELAS